MPGGPGRASAPHQPLTHGCLAGLWQEACVEVYRDRILRGTGDDGYYSTFKLGAIGADLGAVACLFAKPWRHPAPALSEPDQAWLLNEAAFDPAIPVAATGGCAGARILAAVNGQVCVCPQGTLISQ